MIAGSTSQSDGTAYPATRHLDVAAQNRAVASESSGDKKSAGDPRRRSCQRLELNCEWKAVSPPYIFSADETADVGEDDATPVTEDCKAYDHRSTGRILKVTIDVKAMGVGERAAAVKGGTEAALKKAASG